MADKYATFNADGTLNLRLIKGLHAIPKGATPVDERQWQRLINETDGIWTLGGDGTITKEPLPAVGPDYAAIERQWRDGEIESVKWLRERHRDQQELDIATTLTDSEYAELLAYVQLLRGWPQAKSFPNQMYRPVAPGWIAEQVS
ncbi:phage tail protein [Pseudomonas paralactis]|uniref:Phage tail protein n=1 Tax=Pseudomonas paralactis TaxID=1615673 RepID=A0ABS0V4R1_9PSED|nr:phage tail assembly chaperone [Pseudomonas paralactis]MBI6634010.1 phage tail protein [Pseudomonas paralactis]